MFQLTAVNDLVTLIRACYGRYSSYRIMQLGMQEIDELFQFVSGHGSQRINSVYE